MSAYIIIQFQNHVNPIIFFTLAHVSLHKAPRIFVIEVW